jgi:hypothetical protein
MVRIFLAITMIMSFAADAFADRVKTTVPKNRKTLVGTYANYAEGTCRAGAIPQMKVTRKPKHGKVSFRQVSGKLGKNAGPCAGETVKGVAVYYTPKSGYRGEDRFSTGYTAFRYVGSHHIKSISDTYIITVK